MPPNKRPNKVNRDELAIKKLVRKNPRDLDARAKKRQEAVDRLGGEDEYQKVHDKEYGEYYKAHGEFLSMADEKWKALWNEQADKCQDKYDSAEIDAVEQFQMETQWLKDAIRKIKAERQVADVDLDDMIMDLEDKIRNPRRHPRKNPRNQTAMDKMLDSEIKKFGDSKKLDDAIDGECDIARELHREWLEMTPQGEWASFEKMSSKLSDRYESGEISLLEKFKLENQWLRDDMLRRTRLRTVQDVDLDDIIMDLESKVENPKGSGRARKNPPNEDGRTLQERLEEAREALEASVGGDLRELKDEFILKANRRYPNWDINDVQKIKYYQYLTELHKGEVSDELLNEIITDLEDKIRNPNPTRKNPTPISVLRLRENNGDDEYWERLYTIRAARDEAQTRWMEWVQTLTPGTGQTMAAMERWFAFNQPKVHPLSDEKLEQMIEETNFFNRDIIENS